MFYQVILSHGVFDVCWFRKNERLYLKEAREVQEHYPSLSFYTLGKDILVLKGNLEIKDGKEVGQYVRIDMLESDLIEAAA